MSYLSSTFGSLFDRIWVNEGEVGYAEILDDRAAGGGMVTTLWLPLGSAALVTILGAVILWKSIPW